MTAIVLIGVMFDRPALTLRTIAVAALAVLLIAPQALVHPSFQMSFAATLALVAAYERGLPWFSTPPETPWATRIALWGGREAVALVIASIVAGLATTLFAAFHFHRLAPYGVIANLLAMPIVSAWVMPAGLLALFAIPFGFDGFFWRLMGEGIDWMIAVALLVASLPGAVGRIARFRHGSADARHRGPDRALPVANTDPFRRRGLAGRGDHLGQPGAAARHPHFIRRRDRCRPKRRRAALHHEKPQRRFHHQGMARGGWRRARATR